MDTQILRKRLNTYKSGKGRLDKVDDEVVMEVLRAWENWPGPSSELYRDLGLSKMQLVTMIQKGKRLVKKGAVTGGDFKEITVKTPEIVPSSCGIELNWEDGRLIKFSTVDQLIEFLRRTSKSDNL